MSCELEVAIGVLQSASSPKSVLNALVVIRKKVDWPKHKDNVAIIRSKGCLKQFSNILATSPHKQCIDTALSIFGNCMMDRACSGEAVAQHNILSVLTQLIKRFPQDDSVKGRLLRIIGNMCQHRDQWANIIIDRKPMLASVAVEVLNLASQDELPEDIKLTDATILTALRALRELLTSHTVMALVKQLGALKAIGALFIKYSNIWKTTKTKVTPLLEILRVIHEYSKYRFYHSILEMRSTPRGDSLVHLATVLVLSPRKIVKILMNFIRSCKLKSELPMGEICSKFIQVIETKSVQEEFGDYYTEYLQCLCYLLDHPANRSAERCGRAMPLLIRVLDEFSEPSNTAIECSILLIATLNKFKYDTQMMYYQYVNEIVKALCNKLTWVVGPPTSINVKHACEKKRKYIFGPSSPTLIKRKIYEAEEKCNKRFCCNGEVNTCWHGARTTILPPLLSSDDELELFNETNSRRTSPRSPSPCSSSSDAESVGSPTWSDDSAAPSLPHASDSDDYSPVCSEDESIPETCVDNTPDNTDDLCDPLPPVPDLDDSLDAQDQYTETADSKVTESLKVGLRMEIMKMIKTLISMKPTMIQLAHESLLIQLTKCAVVEKYDLKDVLCELLSQNIFLIPIIRMDFIDKLITMRDMPAHRDYCLKCKAHVNVAHTVLRKLTDMAESAVGRGEMAYHLMRSQSDIKEQLVTYIPYIVRNRMLLAKLLIDNHGLSVLIKMLKRDNRQSVQNSLRVLCQLAAHRLLIVNPKDLMSNDLNRPRVNADKYEVSEQCENVVSFILDDGSVVKADRESLITKSDYFSKLLSGYFKERHETEVKLPKVNVQSLTCLLYLLEKVDTTDIFDLNLELETLLDVILLADRFLLFELCVLLTDSVEHYRMLPETVPTIYNWSITSGTNLLRVESVAYALVANIDIKERYCIFVQLFHLGFKDSLIDDICSMLMRYLRAPQSHADATLTRRKTRQHMREQLLKQYV